LKFFVPLNDVPVTILTSVFQIGILFSSFSEDIFFLENFDLFKSKFERVVFELYNYMYNVIFFCGNELSRLGSLNDLKMLEITIDLSI